MSLPTPPPCSTPQQARPGLLYQLPFQGLCCLPHPPAPATENRWNNPSEGVGPALRLSPCLPLTQRKAKRFAVACGTLHPCLSFSSTPPPLLFLSSSLSAFSCTPTQGLCSRTRLPSSGFSLKGHLLCKACSVFLVRDHSPSGTPPHPQAPTP